MQEVTTTKVVKKPKRRCIGCLQRDLKSNLARVVWSGEELLFDEKQAFQARAAYIHRSESCLQKAKSCACWEKALKLSSGTLKALLLPQELQREKSAALLKRVRL